ncbi:MAG: hypothetical protein QM817_30080 [Archangium sp.]
MKRRAFTTVELAICLSISALLVPACYLFIRTLQARHDRALWQLEAASSIRTLSEQRELDRVARPECAVTYRLDGDKVVRSACGTELVLARHVTKFEQNASGATVAFTLRDSETQAQTFEVFIP